MASFTTWARGFARWIKNFLGRSDDRKPTIVAEEYNDWAALYQVTDDGIPGCVALWKIVHRHANADLIFMLIDVARLRQELGVRSSGAPARREPWQNTLSRQLALELKAQCDVDASHLVVICWLKQEQKADPKGRRYSLPTAVFVGGWLCDLQGVSGTIAGDRYASQIVKIIAYKIFRTQATRLVTWEEFVNAFPWLDRLDFWARYYLGQTHILQPPKPKPKNLKRNIKHSSSKRRINSKPS